MKAFSLSRFIRRQGSDLWLSELFGGALAVAYAATVAILLAMIVHGHFRQQRLAWNQERLADDRIILEKKHEELERKVRIRKGVELLQRKNLPPDVMEKLVGIVHHNSSRYGYDPLLLLAVIHVESVFDEKALGRYRDGRLSGALGLMQLKFETAREMALKLGIELTNPEQLLDSEVNVPLGIYYLTRMVIRFKSLSLGILAYNQGPGHIRKTLSERLPLSTRYYRKVMNRYWQMRRALDSQTSGVG